MHLFLILLLTLFQGNPWDKANSEVVRLVPSRFNQLPKQLIQELERRGCTIPQAWASLQPDNVIRGEFLTKGQSDWAVLCSVNMKSTILVFANGSFESPMNVAPEDDRNELQVAGKGQIGYSREIKPVGEKYILERYRITSGPKPPSIDHLGIDDALTEKGSVTHYFYQGKWLQLTGSD